MAYEVPEIDYTRYTNRQLAAIPLAVLGVALVVLLGSFALSGTPVPLGIDFTGGTELTIETTSSQAEIRSAFDSQPTSIQRVQLSDNQNRYIVTFQAIGDTETQAQQLVGQANDGLQPVGDGDVVVSTQQTSPSFSGSNQYFAQIGLVIAFLGMSVLAFLLFRTFVPSVAIVVSAFSDIVIPLAAMNLLGIKLSLGTVAALLMLIGYSVDSDILLNNHILRRSGDFYESTHRAMRTGVTMTLTSMSAMFVMAVVSFLFGIDLLTSIGLVLVLGLAADLMNTYLLNLSLLRWYKLGEVSP
jgi:preprotein translocase subunit SecF